MKLLTNQHIVRIIRETALIMKHEFDSEDVRFVNINQRTYNSSEFIEFKRDLVETGNKVRLMFLEYHLPLARLEELIESDDYPIILFEKIEGDLIPVIIWRPKGNLTKCRLGLESNEILPYQKPIESEWLINEDGEPVFFVVVAYESLVSEYGYNRDLRGEPISPLLRLFKLLKAERKEIFYTFFYGILVGVIGLVLPVGLQTTVELISGGLFFSSIYLLIGFIILGVLVTGGLHIMQITLVEHIQRRIFAKASLEFAYRIPRIKAESLMGNYAPELVNRFFDVLTLMKALPKLLIDLSSSVIQILFGLLLLSLYHPFFVFFSLILLTFLTIIFYLTGPRGLSSSIQESKYKYKVVQWLEELARAMNSFKLAGNTNLPMQKSDGYVNQYLRYRRVHFRVLLTQISFIILFKALVTGGLLIVGTILVVDREITLGQFVAAEVIIILILISVEKIITYMDVVYDMLTAVDKVANVTDLPLEKVGGLDFPNRIQQGYEIRLKGLKYAYPSGYVALEDISFEVKSGERICIAGHGGSGKTTLSNIIAGLIEGFQGIVTINGYSLRDLDLIHLRDKIAKNISQEEIFEGTILENITVGKPMESVEDAVNAMERVGLSDWVNSLPEGLNTPMLSAGKGLPSSINQKIILARCFAKRPNLIILNDYFDFMKKSDKEKIIRSVVDKENRWTLIVVSNDQMVMAACDKVILLKEARLNSVGTYQELLELGKLEDILD